MQVLGSLSRDISPRRMIEYRDRYEHHRCSSMAGKVDVADASQTISSAKGDFERTDEEGVTLLHRRRRRKHPLPRHPPQRGRTSSRRRGAEAQ